MVLNPCSRVSGRLWMNVLGKPIQRDLAPRPFCFRSVKDYLAHRGELRAQANVIDKAGNLVVPFASFDLAGEQIGKRRQRLPIDAAIGRDDRAV